MRNKRFVSFLIGISLVFGCAGNSIKHFDNKIAQLDKKGIILATVTYENKLDQTGKIIPGAFFMHKNDGEENGYRLYGSDHFRLFVEDKKLWLIVLGLYQGDYFISSIGGAVQNKVLLPHFNVKVNRDFKASANEILYIGNIHLIVRKKNSDSDPSVAVPATTLIDSLALIGSTMSVEINDEYQVDKVEFEKAYPTLKNYIIKKNILQKQPISPSVD